jgi:hypothetical protein
MTGDSKPGDAVADKWRDVFDRNRRERELAVARLEVRAEQRSAPDVEENTGVIHREALERQAQREAERAAADSSPPRPTVLHVTLAVARKFPPWGAVLVALAAIAAYVALRLLGVKP